MQMRQSAPLPGLAVGIHRLVQTFAVRRRHSRYIAKDPDNKHFRHKAITAVAAKMARVAHSIVCSGTDYRPFYERPMPSGRTSL